MRIKLVRGAALVGLAGVLLLYGTATPALAEAIVVQPGESIQAAIDAAPAGATVTVAAGTYHEAVCLTRDAIKLRGEQAVIKPPAQPPQTPCAFDPSGQTIGIAIVGALDPVTGEVTDPVSDITVSGFTVEGFASYGIGMIGGRDVDIVDNTAIDNDEYGIARFVSVGGTLKNNRATGSDEAGIYFGDSPDANATIVGNTAWNNDFIGIFVRDSSNGTVRANTSFGNCIGILVLSSHGIAHDWTLQANSVHDNTKACPGSDEGPPASGIGIGIAGARSIVVQANVITGNRPTGPTIASGGVVMFGLGNDPVGNTVKANTLRDNDPDLSYDGTGSGNTFVANSCSTSIPDGLC